MACYRPFSAQYETVKDRTLQTLITARALIEQAEQLCELGDRYLATAALIVLQDGVELVFLAVLIEREVDEQVAIEKLSFDDMISAVKKSGIDLPKSGTLKTMNKLRVTAKHHGQVMEPLTVQGHLSTAKQVIDAVLSSALGKTLKEIFLVELIGTNTAPRIFLNEAVASLEAKDYLGALIATRKAFYLEFEHDYCIYDFREIKRDQPVHYPLLGILYGGRKAAYWTRNKEWMDTNVKTPFDYIQIDEETWRIDAMEWGINTQTLNNIRRLTPTLIRFDYQDPWYIRKSAGYNENNASRENASTCLDLTIEAIRRKHSHMRAARTLSDDKPYETPPAYVGQKLFQKPDINSKVVYVLNEEDRYEVKATLTGFDVMKTFYWIKCTHSSGDISMGFVERSEVEPLDETSTRVEISDPTVFYPPTSVPGVH